MSIISLTYDEDEDEDEDEDDSEPEGRVHAYVISIPANPVLFRIAFMMV